MPHDSNLGRIIGKLIKIIISGVSMKILNISCIDNKTESVEKFE